MGCAAGSVRRWAGRLVDSRGRYGLVQAAKMALAAVIAWLLARQFHQPQSFIAPYVAVFLISQTVYRSVTDSVRQLTAVILGVVLSFCVITLVPQQVAALAVAVFVGMLLGRLGWLGDSGIWVGVVALLMVTSRTADNPLFLLYRVVESLIGAGVGIAVNLLVLPPGHLRRAERVVTDVGTEIRRLLADMAEGVRREWRDWDTAAWLRRAHELDETVYRARDAVGRGHEGTRFNLEWRSRPSARRPDPAVSRAAIDTLGEVTRQVQRMAETLSSANRSGGAIWPTDAAFNERFAALLERLAAALKRYRAADGGPRDALAEASQGIDGTEHLTGEPRAESRTGWSAQGALLVAAERAFRAVEADTESGAGRER